MKTTKLFPLALAALMLGACSSDSINEQGTDKGFDADGNGFLSVSINLPTQKTTRAANDVFKDGTTAEYEVKDATLLLFGGADAATATCQGVYSIDLSQFDDNTDDDQITTQYQTVQKVDAVTGTYAYALVVLNKNDIDLDAFKSKTLKEITNGATSVTSETDFTSKGFLMTNAPLSDKAGTSTGVGAKETTVTTTILTPVTENIYPSKSEAEAGDKAEITVERAVAKVSLTTKISGDKELAITNNTGKTSSDKISFSIDDAWALANKNNVTYLVRNWNQIRPSTLANGNKFGDEWYLLKSEIATENTAAGENVISGVTDARTSNPYRFAGTNNIGAGSYPLGYANEAYRTYFGADPNYDSNNAVATALPTADDFTADTKYCLENTFDVQHQNVKYTTCAIVKATFGDGADFYTRGTQTNVIYKESDIKTYAVKSAIDLYGQAAIDKALAAITDKGTDTYTGVVNEDNVTLTYETDASTGQYKVASVSVKVSVSKNGTAETSLDKTYADTDFTGDADPSLAQLNSKSAFLAYKYVGGAAYYTILIKHFGDELTPWNAEGKSQAYPDNNENQYLGRYGVLRNNWYDIEVTGLTGLGSPVIPNVIEDTTTDDKVERYIACKINVLSWAKRTQSAVLQ